MPLLNEKYPVFFNLNRIQVHISGGDEIALEKLHFLWKNSPSAHIEVWSEEFIEEISHRESNYPNTTLHHQALVPGAIPQSSIVIIAEENEAFRETQYKRFKEAGFIVNVADVPKWCDFYLGSIVNKGPLKIAISTNGKAPILARRLREWLEAVLPDNIEETLEQLQRYRKNLKGNFEEKLNHLNQLTKHISS